MTQLWLLLVLQLIFVCFGAEIAETPPVSSLEELKKLPIAKLRLLLSERGLECKGCADKDDYVQMSFSNQHLPILPPPVVPESTPETSEKAKKEADDIMESLKKGGFGGAKMFTKEDLENLSADEMAEKFGSPKTGPGSKRKNKKNKDTKPKKEKKDKKEKKEKKDKKKSKLGSSSGTKSVPKEEPDEDRIEL